MFLIGYLLSAPRILREAFGCNVQNSDQCIFLVVVYFFLNFSDEQTGRDPGGLYTR